MSLPALYELVGQHRELERLAGSDEVDEQTLRDTLEGLEGSIQLKAQSCAAMVANLSAWAMTIDGAAQRLSERAEKVHKRAEWLRAYLLVNMQQAGITKIETPELVASIRKNPASVQIADGAVLPERFMVPSPPTPPPRPDKKAIGAALKAGEDVPGCSLVQSERLEIK
jgi:hypothetical protein